MCQSEVTLEKLPWASAVCPCAAVTLLPDTDLVTQGEKCSALSMLKWKTKVLPNLLISKYISAFFPISCKMIFLDECRISPSQVMIAAVALCVNTKEL